MNNSERQEIKAEVLMKAFVRYCLDQSVQLKVKSSKQDEFLLACVERMTKIVNKANKAGVKP
jgi:hypothetical protein